MTNEQSQWLRDHPEYRPLGKTGGHSIFTKRGTLRPDGTMVPVSKAQPLVETGGSFGVGIPGDLRDAAKNPEIANRSAPGFQRSAAASPTSLPPDDRARFGQQPAPGPLPKKV
jgi:hypothetical protein